MSLKYCTITGADDNVKVADLEKLAEEFPFVEFGILFYEKKVGKQRYPTMSWINKFKQIEANKSAHLCGSYVDTFMYGDANLTKYMKGFKRIQLNFSWKEKHFEPNKMLESVLNAPQNIIIQENKNNNGLWRELMAAKNYQILYDESGGNGKTTTEWQAPKKGIFCGYAGGLGPDNLSEQLALIDKLANESDYSIDMESNIRTKNEFDIEKAINCLRIAERYA